MLRDLRSLVEELLRAVRHVGEGTCILTIGEASHTLQLVNVLDHLTEVARHDVILMDEVGVARSGLVLLVGA